MEGILLIDKPKGITSHDVIYRVRRATGIKKVGHGGTLDPNASGLLIVGVGRSATKTLGDFAKNKKKTYIAEITFGQERDTDDAEGEITLKSDIKPEKEKIIKELKKFIGKQKQTPPQYSAIKKGGQKAYDLARKGKEVILEPRNIEVFRAEFISYKYPLLKVEFEVSSGTYIRALARDLGRALGSVAYLSGLVRTKVGEYDLKDAKSLEEIENGNI